MGFFVCVSEIKLLQRDVLLGFFYLFFVCFCFLFLHYTILLTPSYYLQDENHFHNIDPLPPPPSLFFFFFFFQPQF